MVKQVKLMDLTKDVQAVEFSVPKALQSVLLLGYSNSLANEFPVSSKIILSNETGRIEVQIKKANATSCNWLRKFSLEGYLISNPKSGDWNWTNILTSDKKTVLIATNLPVGGSIWLSYTRPSGWDLPFFGESSKKRLEQKKVVEQKD